ncbi:MAG TPA: ATP-binding protein [Candidatus Saccharimonadales bacterium]|nr:ATP-binding protein [Candidatus Saccharimonadales bacterium]
MAKIVPTKPFLLLLYGFPGAGKTFFARQLCERLQAAHVQGDRIRAELFEKPRYDKQEDDIVTQLMNYMTSEFMNTGTSVVYDTNVTRLRQRRALRDLARQAHAEPLLIWMQIDPESALAREQKRDRRRADDKYAAELEQSDFNGIAGHMQNPGLTEDYVVISGKHSFASQYNAVIRKMRELGLLNLSDADAHMAKPGLVNLVPKTVAGRVDMSRRNIVIR